MLSRSKVHAAAATATSGSGMNSDEEEDFNSQLDSPIRTPATAPTPIPTPREDKHHEGSQRHQQQQKHAETSKNTPFMPRRSSRRTNNSATTSTTKTSAVSPRYPPSETGASGGTGRSTSRSTSSARTPARGKRAAAADSNTAREASRGGGKGMGMKPGPDGEGGSDDSNDKSRSNSSSGEDERRSGTPGCKQQEMEENAEGVGFAIKRLERMERRLQRAVKRQKLKVEESVACIEADAPEERAFKPRPTRNLRGKNNSRSSRTISTNKVPPAADPLPTPERETADSEGGDKHLEGTEPNDHAEVITEMEPAEVARGAARPPAVNSANLPLPWRGRLGYACLNTYLRAANPPVFSSRTCRMSSIIDHRCPLQDPSQPEHPTKNWPDKSQRSEVALGLKFVQGLGLANARDIAKMVRWNDRYGIKFMRLSSQMFPFASHHEHGYKLEPFAAGVLAEAGRVIGELGHRVTTHPGQYTQLGSPRPEVVEAAVRDLEYHDEMLTLLGLPLQQNRDAVIILHMGGAYGDKPATVARFKARYTSLLSESIKRRLVLENDDVSWSVHDILPICEELNIPLVLDYHHHNIVFDASQVREGTADLEPLIPRIRATWERKGITMKMHYSEPCAGAVTPRDRRKHSPRVATLPPCPPDVDLMIEAKDKEQAVFELMRNFRLPGFEKVQDMIPHERGDEPRAPVGVEVRKGSGAHRSRKRKVKDEDSDGDGDGVAAGGHKTAEEEGKKTESGSGTLVNPGLDVAEEEIGMGGPEGRVYWPIGMEEWLRPRKRDRRMKVPAAGEFDD